ncbi:MAG: hypothetical protein IPK64_00315 [bacterium]|nr:hypothetical protein [bacterium]
MSRSSPRFARRLPLRVRIAAVVLVVAALLLLGVGRAPSKAPVDLRQERDNLPYRFRTVATMVRGLAIQRGWITHQLYADIDGDGVDDHFRASDQGICGTLWTPAGPGGNWQSNLPVAFVRKGPCASVDGVWDLDGDGRAEVVSTAGTPDGFRWLLNVMDAATGAPKWSVELPAGLDDRGDGNWDGFYRAFGPFTAHLPEGPRAALLVGIEAGHDERPRGALALDARDGTVLWRHRTAAKPVAASFRIVDLDNDGRQEICFLGAGVSNFDSGEEVDGVDDHHAMLFVLNDDGSLRWRRPLGPAPASGCLETVDLEGDGGNELLVAAFLPELGHETLAVLSGADGTVIASAELPSSCQGLTVSAHDGDVSAWLTFESRARRYTLSRSGITPGPEAILDGAAQVALVADLVGDARPEAVLGALGGWNWLVDDRLQPIALLHDTAYRCVMEGTSLRRMPDNAQRLVVLGDREHDSAEFVIEPSPTKPPWALIVAGLGIVGGAGLAWRARARRLSAAALRELRLQVLDRIVMADHGKLGALRTARNLIRYFSAFEAGLSDEAKLRDQVGELAANVLDVDLPELEATVEVAQFARLEPAAVQQAAAALAQVREALTAALSGAPADQASSPATRLHEAIENTDARFKALRLIAESHFSASPDAVLARSLKAHADTIARLGVEVARPASPMPDCLIDPKDLAFVLDNLVENALRAMATAPTRRLVLDWRPAGQLIAITVQDTGAGMTPAEAKAALEPGEGKRAGGGRGLPGSCRLLAKYDGKLSVGATAPGQGTTMILHLRIASQGSTHEPARN